MMNKYQEALQKIGSIYLQENGFGFKNQEAFLKSKIDRTRVFAESVKILRELVDKEIPMKVDLSTKRLEDYTGEDWYFQKYYDCPKCKQEIEDGIHYCFECGQKLDWSRDENES